MIHKKNYINYDNSPHRLKALLRRAALEIHRLLQTRAGEAGQSELKVRFRVQD